jgi:preprotein translocase subunit SecB
MINYKIIAKYINDFKFEIPSPNAFFSLEKNISNYKVNIDIKSKVFKDKIIGVEMGLNLKSSQENIEKINAQIVYTTLIELEGDLQQKEKLAEIILIKVPTTVYPQIRKILIDVFESSGFKDIKVDKDVDFRKLYNSRKAQ